MQRFSAIGTTQAKLASILFACTACGESSAPSPFVDRDGGVIDAAADTTADVPSESPTDAVDQSDPTIGGPCLDDAQCDDAIDCTFEACDQSLRRCRFTPDDSACSDDVFCNGVEVCDLRRGCSPGEPVSCSDGSTCTIDACDELTRSCEHRPRDADGDGDPVWNCPGGGDCNDSDPRISSLASEICANDRDDNCDGRQDETDCESPQYDSCVDPLIIDQAGVYSVSLAAAKADYSANCAGSSSGWRDVVVAIEVPAGAPQDVDIVATAARGNLALASQTLCGDAASEVACGPAMALPSGGAVSRLVLRQLDPGAHALLVFATADVDVTLKVAFRPPEVPPANETCGTAAPLEPATTTTARLVGTAADAASACGGVTGELFYRFELGEPRDVHLHATSLDDLGTPVLSLRTADCVAGELTCNMAQNAHVFWRASAGPHYVAVSATGPSDVSLRLELEPASTPPSDESCDSTIALAPNSTLEVPLTGHVDDVQLGCLVGAVDAAYALDVTERSDVLLLSRLSQGDSAAVALARDACTPEDRLACSVSSRSPVRASVHDLLPGNYRVIAESTQGNPMTMTALVRPAVSPVLVAFADECADAVLIPTSGGFFQGNTANARADYATGCDLGGQTAGGAREQMLKLELTERKRVIFDMRGSAYATMLAVRRGPDCPGVEVEHGCSAGYGSDRSFLDLTLDAGLYFVQIDGYAGSEGRWFLDVFVLPP